MAYTTINKPSQYFNTVLYTGNGSATQSITGVGFKPDLVWVKNRTAAVSHCWVDGVRAAPNQLGSDLTDAENSSGNNYVVYGGVSVLGSDGFTASLGTDPTYQATNKSSQNYVAWNWLAANSTTSNTSGTITSTVSANTTSGFSIVSYTGTGANATVGHGLGVAPKMVIVKGRSTTYDWVVWQAAFAGTDYIVLNKTDAKGTVAAVWNSTIPTSTVFSLGSNLAVNQSGATQIAYCFAEVKGFSKFGSYTGNGNANGTFVYTGFKPRYFMVKRTDAAGNDWILMDTARDPINVATQELYANLAIAEGTAANNYDILSNGFKARRSNAAVNASGGTYIYMAFAENPFVSSTLVPTTAR